jgi:hypothetical protein
MDGVGHPVDYLRQLDTWVPLRLLLHSPHELKHLLCILLELHYANGTILAAGAARPAHLHLLLLVFVDAEVCGMRSSTVNPGKKR